MRLNRLFHKAVASAAAACMALGGFSQFALADYVAQGDELSDWVCQVVVQNGANDQNANLWMNNGVCSSMNYKTEQHIVLDPPDGAFANAEDVLNFAAIYFSYYGEFSGDAQFDITLTNVTIYSNGYEPIALADYSSVDAGTNYPVSSNDYAVRYDFQDQLDLSIRTDVLRNLDRIEFDLYVDNANFSDAEQVDDASAEPEEEYTELAVAGEDSNIDVIFYSMDSGWTWLEAGDHVKLKYQTDEHITIAVDGATSFAEAVGPMTVAGFLVGYYTDQFPEDANYRMDYTISNVVMNFDGYDPIAFGDLSSENAEKDRDGAYAGRNVISLESFPADADTAEMFRHLISIEFDYRVDFLGVAATEDTDTDPEEPTTEETEKSTEESTEEPTTEETGESTEESTEEPASTASEEPETAESAEESTEAPETKEDSGSNMAKIIVTIVAVVILFAALAAVGVMYIKKSKQI